MFDFWIFKESMKLEEEERDKPGTEVLNMRHVLDLIDAEGKNKPAGKTRCLVSREMFHKEKHRESIEKIEENSDKVISQNRIL